LAVLDVGQRFRWAFWPAFVACAAALWWGRRWMASTVLTRTVGIAFAILMGLLPALFLVMPALTVEPLIGILFCLSIPLLLWDFFVVQPHRGRFARAREARLRPGDGDWEEPDE
jgi:hypothetical protein